jgi:hypothetical protein
MWASSLYEPVREEPSVRFAVREIDVLRVDVSVLVDFPVKVLGVPDMYRVFRSGVVVKAYVVGF